MKSTMTDQELEGIARAAVHDPRDLTPEDGINIMHAIADAAVAKYADTLRDEFAKAALPHVLRGGLLRTDIAWEAYRIADAMLEVRNANR